MDPYTQQPQHSLQPPSQNPYEFIMNPQQPPKRKLINLSGGNSFGMLLGLILGGALLLMLVLAIIVSLLGGSKANTGDFISLSQTQQELMRVANQGASDATHQTTKDLAITAEYTIRSQQREVLAFLATHGKTVGGKELALKQNARTDQQFRAAEATSTFDLVFSQTMQNQLTTYASTLKQLHAAASGKAEREMLSGYYEQTQQLISQIPYTQDTIESTGQ